MNLIIESILVGFGIYSILFSLFRNRLEKWNNELSESIDSLACILFSLGGIFLIGQSLIELICSFTHVQDNYEQFRLSKIIQGPYILTNWVRPILLLMLTQLLWFKKIKRSRFIRFTIGIIMMLPFEKLVITITSLHRDYLPSLWKMQNISNIILDRAINLFVFVLIFWVVYYIKGIILSVKRI